MSTPPDTTPTQLTHTPTRNLLEDPASPYFLHPADGPGLKLVSEPLTETNYQSWSHSMLLGLKVKNKIGFIDSSLPKPTEDPILINTWERNNTIVVAWIFNAISKEINSSIRPASTPFSRPPFSHTPRPPNSYTNTRPNLPPAPNQPTSFRPQFPNQFKRKDRPFCTHCNMAGHTIDTCFKIHGFPPGYRPPFPRQTTPTANQFHPTFPDSHQSGIQDFVKNLKPDQYAYLSSLFSTQQQTQHSLPQSDDSTSNTFNVTTQSVGRLKEKIAGEIQLPANKQKLNGKAGFLKDNLSLAYYNVAPGDSLSLSLRERGGRKR
ncbi:hypothetical protein RD792_007587 [Penstemon davidsonii]|uniref:Ubiquitin-like domain-containing protein n=1 Tax=Penstemon davidsonii TaxID=160366 RepID=A0ABR0D6T4_9LAMI|nr:hypothetical protein RD792_007587 [Penstemon davidsonii]